MPNELPEIESGDFDLINQSLERLPKDSARWYSEVISRNALL